MTKTKKKACGLCGVTENLIKTECCNNWICDDVHTYVLFSYATNSCYRNHDRYTICAAHYKSGHSGRWQECKKCRDEYRLENYIDFATNDFNFEKLKNPPTITMICACCGFKSNNIRDFLLQTSKGFYCSKKQCQKMAIRL